MAQLPQWLTRAVALGLPTYNTAFLIVHEGRDGVWVLLHWWIGGEMLQGFTCFSSYENPGAFVPLPRDAQHADLYLGHFNDESDRVINAAAIALGRSESPKAFDALAKLVHKPSWKNQSLMSALSGLRELRDPRGFDIAFGALSDLNLLRWRLPNPPVWDFRVMAAETIAALGRSDAAYPLIFARCKKSDGGKRSRRHVQ
ncbi:MAG: HEAT repeat domain-containing protein [Blastocatellia bacterium]